MVEITVGTEIGRSKGERLGSAMCIDKTGRTVGSAAGEEVYSVIK